MARMIYRGYKIEKRPMTVSHSLSNLEFIIYKDDVVVCSQPSLEFAKHWIDQEAK